MAIKLSDVIENINTNFPVVDATGNHVKGVLFAPGTPAIDNENLVSIPAAKRSTSCILVSTDQKKIFTYSGSDLTDQNWGDAENWSEISGGDPGAGGITLGADTAYNTTDLLTDNGAAIADFTLDTTYTEAIDRLNELMGKIVPTAPAALSLDSLSEVNNTGASGEYDYIYTNSSYTSELPYEALRATNQGIQAASGASVVSTNDVVRWMSSPTRHLRIKYAGLGGYQANPGDSFEVRFNGITLNNTVITLADSLSHGQTFTNGSSSVSLSPNGFPSSGSGAGFYFSYNEIKFDLGGNLNTLEDGGEDILQAGVMNNISIYYNDTLLTGFDFFYNTNQADISTNITNQAVPNITPLNFENAIRFVTHDDVSSTGDQLTMSVTAQNISGSKTYGVNNYNTSDDTYVSASNSDIFDGIGTLTYPTSVPANYSTGGGLLYRVKDDVLGKFSGSVLGNRPEFERDSAHGGSSNNIRPNTGNFVDYSYIIYPSDSFDYTTRFWSGSNTSYQPSVGGNISSMQRVKDPQGGIDSNTFSDTPSGILDTNLYSAQYANGNGSAGINIHKHDAIVAGGMAMNLTQAELSEWFDGDSLYPAAQNYQVDSSREANQYVTMGFEVNDATQNFNLTLNSSTGIAGAWVYMKDDAGWTTANTSTNGWCTLNQPFGGNGVPGAAQDQGQQGAVNNGTSIPTGTAINNQTYSITSGTANFFNATISSVNGKMVYLRFKLTSNQSISNIIVST